MGQKSEFEVWCEDLCWEKMSTRQAFAEFQMDEKKMCLSVICLEVGGNSMLSDYIKQRSFCKKEWGSQNWTLEDMDVEIHKAPCTYCFSMEEWVWFLFVFVDTLLICSFVFLTIFCHFWPFVHILVLSGNQECTTELPDPAEEYWGGQPQGRPNWCSKGDQGPVWENFP